MDLEKFTEAAKGLSVEDFLKHCKMLCEHSGVMETIYNPQFKKYESLPEEVLKGPIVNRKDIMAELMAGIMEVLDEIRVQLLTMSRRDVLRDLDNLGQRRDLH